MVIYNYDDDDDDDGILESRRFFHWPLLQIGIINRKSHAMTYLTT